MRLHRLRRTQRRATPKAAKSRATGRKASTLASLLHAIEPDTLFSLWQGSRRQPDPDKRQREFRIVGSTFTMRPLGRASYLVVSFADWTGKPHPITAVPAHAEISAVQQRAVVRAWIDGGRAMLREKDFTAVLRATPVSAGLLLGLIGPDPLASDQIRGGGIFPRVRIVGDQVQMPQARPVRSDTDLCRHAWLHDPRMAF